MNLNKSKTKTMDKEKRAGAGLLLPGSWNYMYLLCILSREKGYKKRIIDKQTKNLKTQDSEA